MRRLPIALVLVASLTASCPGPTSNPDDPRIDTAQQHVLKREFAEAEGVLDDVLADYPDTGRALLLQGWALKEQQKHALAIPLVEHATTLEPFEKQENAWFLLGWCRYYEGDLAGAREAFDAHLERAPGDPDTWFGLGVVCLDEGALDDAEAAFLRAIELLEEAIVAAEQPGAPPSPLRTDLARAWYRLAEVRTQAERWEDALEACKFAINLVQTFGEAWCLMQTVLLELGEEDQAEAAGEMCEQFRGGFGG